MRALQHLGDAAGLLHLRRQAPGGVDGDVRVVAEHVHAELDRGVGHQAADLAEADDAERLAGQLEAGEGLLAVLDRLVEVGRAPGRAASTKRSAGARLRAAISMPASTSSLTALALRARRVEHRHAARAHRLDRDVVGAGAGAARSPARWRESPSRAGRPSAPGWRPGSAMSLPTRVALGRQRFRPFGEIWFSTRTRERAQPCSASNSFM